MASQSSQTSDFSALLPHFDFNDKNCPACGQEIPPEKLEAIGGRIAAREREQMQTITAQLEKQHAVEKAQAESKAKADLETERQESARREARTLGEAQIAADKRINERLAEAEQTRAALVAGWQRELSEAQTARTTAEQTSAAQQAEMLELRESSAKRIEAIEAEVKQQEQAIREEANKNAEAAVTSGSLRSRERNGTRTQPELQPNKKNVF